MNNKITDIKKITLFNSKGECLVSQDEFEEKVIAPYKETHPYGHILLKATKEESPTGKQRVLKHCVANIKNIWDVLPLLEDGFFIEKHTVPASFKSWADLTPQYFDDMSGIVTIIDKKRIVEKFTSLAIIPSEKIVLKENGLNRVISETEYEDTIKEIKGSPCKWHNTYKKSILSSLKLASPSLAVAIRRFFLKEGIHFHTKILKEFFEITGKGKDVLNEIIFSICFRLSSFPEIQENIREGMDEFYIIKTPSYRNESTYFVEDCTEITIDNFIEGCLSSYSNNICLEDFFKAKKRITQKQSKDLKRIIFLVWLFSSTSPYKNYERTSDLVKVPVPCCDPKETFNLLLYFCPRNFF